MKELLEALISFKTVYPDYEQMKSCIDYIKKYFNNSKLNIRHFSQNDDISLVISNCNSKELDIIFCGHIDVVSAKDELFIPRIDGEKLIARGSSDMKGQVAVMMETMLNSVGVDNRVALFLTSDEERGGFNGVRYLLENEGYRSKIAVVPDGGVNFDLVIEEKGVLQLKLSFTGKEAHSAYLWNGDNSAKRLINVFNQLSRIYKEPQNNSEWKTSINLAKFNCNADLNKVPEYAEMFLDVRHIYIDTKESILKSIETIDKDVKVEVLAEGSSFICESENPSVMNYVSVAEKVLGKKIQKNKIPSSSDARFFSENKIPTIIMNPVCGNLHMDDEWVDLQSLEKLKSIYIDFLKCFKDLR